MKKEGAEVSEEYLIWSVRHNAWWKPEKMGYTPSWSNAGRYSKKEAFKICAQSNFECLDEVPVPISYFEFQVKVEQTVKELTQ